MEREHKQLSNEEATMSEIETQRLIIRAFTPDDWQAVQALALDKESHKRDPHDPPWPTSDAECRGFAEYLAENSDRFLAVCLKSADTPIGLLSPNHVDENRQLELGYQIHSEYQDNDLDREALESIIDFAFAHGDIQSIDTRTNSEWAEQIAPLKSFGFAPLEDDPGHLGITKADWEKRPK